MSAAPDDSRGLSGAGFELPDLIRLRHAAARLCLRSHVTPVSWRAGMHVSRIRGRGMSFAESRLYQPGDDVRLIDWRVTARTGRPHTKVFEEEKERAVFVAAQFAPTMYFGTRVAFKHVVAAELAALVGWATVSCGDRLGALLASARGHVERRPAAGRRAVMALLSELAALASPPAAGVAPALADTLRRVARVARPGSLVFVIGDFYDFDDEAARHLARLAQHNDVVICQVLDPVEIDAPPPGVYPVSDGRRVGELHAIRADGHDTWRTLELRLREPLRQFARRHRLPRGLVCAGRPVAEQIEAILAREQVDTLDERKHGSTRRPA